MKKIFLFLLALTFAYSNFSGLMAMDDESPSMAKEDLETLCAETSNLSCTTTEQTNTGQTPKKEKPQNPKKHNLLNKTEIEPKKLLTEENYLMQQEEQRKHILGNVFSHNFFIPVFFEKLGNIIAMDINGHDYNFLLQSFYVYCKTNRLEEILKLCNVCTFFRTILKKIPMDLDLTRYKNLRKEQLKSIILNFKLNSLVIKFNPNIDDEFIEFLNKNCPNLKYIELGLCANLINPKFRLNNLINLGIYHCTNLKTLELFCPNIIQINLCNNFELKEIESILKPIDAIIINTYNCLNLGRATLPA